MVVNPRKPEKLQIVFDCGAKHKGLSLNKVLMQGPDLVNSLVGVLTRFRKYPVSLVADIEAMFHQVMVRPADRNSLRFLWWPAGDLSKNPATYRMKVHIFGATSSPSCAAFALRQTVVDFGGDYEATIFTAIEQNFYVDDCLLSVPNVAMAFKMVEGLTSILRNAGFKLTKWISKSQEIIDSIPEPERSKTLHVGALMGSTNERVLGVMWDINSTVLGLMCVCLGHLARSVDCYSQ